MAYTPATFEHRTITLTDAIPAPVSPAYAVSYVSQLVIDQKVLTCSSAKYSIRDGKGARLFDVKVKNPLGYHTKRVLRDASGKTLVLMKQRIVTLHDRWEAYRGKSDRESDLIFTMGKSYRDPMTPSFEVFLAGNVTSVPDFFVRGGFFERTFKVLYNNVTIAKAKKKWNVSAVVLGKNQYAVTVYPGVDHAFIASIMVILDQVNFQGNSGQKEDDRYGYRGI